MVYHSLTRREKIKKGFRHKIQGTNERPRLCVFRSNMEIYAQLVNDSEGKTILTVSSLDKNIVAAKVNKVEKSKLVGVAVAEKAKAAGITTVVFDRNGFLYHGRVKSLADGAREGGLNF